MLGRLRDRPEPLAIDPRHEHDMAGRDGRLALEPIDDDEPGQAGDAATAAVGIE